MIKRECKNYKQDKDKCTLYLNESYPYGKSNEAECPYYNY